jgi:hypothetical protein
MKYRIWSIEHTAWWRPQEHGYTTEITVAGIYTEEDARRICFHANWANNDTPQEAMVPVFGETK